MAAMRRDWRDLSHSISRLRSLQQGRRFRQLFSRIERHFHRIISADLSVHRVYNSSTSRVEEGKEEEEGQEEAGGRRV